MSTTEHSEFQENFLREPSQVDDIIKFLSEMQKSNKMEGKKDSEIKQEISISASVTDTNFLVTERTQKATKRSRSPTKKLIAIANMNQMSFMRQIDVTQENRIKAREERIRVATNFRRLGNAEYRKANFDKAIEYYKRGLNYINDSPVLYVNCALCYIKKREYKRALIDLDYVLKNLDGRCLQAWLYMAGAFKRMNDEDNYQECVNSARRFNRSHLEYIDNFLDKMRTDF